MTETPKGGLAAEFAKHLPLQEMYRDSLKPASKQVGHILEDIVKVIELAIAPVQLVAALQDRFRHFIDKAVRNVPEENQIAPPPQILGPVLESIRYEPEGTPIDEMFSELLSKSMDKAKVADAHPSYPLIIKQLSSDEAKILASLKKQAYPFYFTESDDVFQHTIQVDEDQLPREGLIFPENVSFYFEHMVNLGLVYIERFHEEVAYKGPARVRQGLSVLANRRLTPFGEHFVHACIKDKDADSEGTTSHESQ